MGPELIFLVIGLIATALYFGSNCFREEKWYIAGTGCCILISSGLIIYVNTAYSKIIGWVIALCCGCSMLNASYKKIVNGELTFSNFFSY